MFHDAFPALIQNAALLLAIAFVYDVTTSRYRMQKPGLLAQLSIGVTLGVLCIIIMLSSWHYVTGIVFDTRSVLLGVVGLFFGVVPTVVAMAVAAAFRLSLGGPAALTGVAVILASGTLGLVWRYYRGQAAGEFCWRELYLFGVLVHAVMLALMFLLPWTTALHVLAQISLPVLLIFPLATALLGSLMVNRLGREDFSTQLQASEERLRLALMAANQGLYDLNVQTGEAKISPEYATMLGYDPVGFQLTVNKWIERMHPDDREPVATAYRDYIAGKIPEYRVEFRQRTKAGGWKWILSLGKVVEYDNAGRPLRMLGTHTDITERKQAEEALRENEIFIRTVLDNLPIGIAVNAVAPAVEFLYMNDNFPKFYHTTREALATSDAFWEAAYEDPIFREAIRKQVMEACASGDPSRMQWEDVPIFRAGEETAYIVARNMSIPGQEMMISTVWDVTDRKRNEAEKEKLQAQLLQSQKMESVGRLAGGVAHDFNNMLQTILGYCDLSLSELEATNPLHENLREIHKAAMRSADLTRQLLAFARKQTVSPKILDLNDTVGGMLKMLQRLLGEDIDLAWLPGHDLWPVKMDPSQLDQILANLAVNARDAIADTGKITIETENVSRDAAYCADHPDCLPGEYVLLAVSDNGCGMDKEILAQIFEPFFTTKEKDKGTGLGLATVYGVVRQNNGFINVYSEPGQGTTFSIYLPSFSSEEVTPTETRLAEEPTGGTETVLLVEDEATLLHLGKTILQRLGYTVLAASTPMAAIELAQEHPGEIHLLITDVVMPEMNGRDLAKRLVSLRPTMHCLFMSGYTANVIAHHGVLDTDIHFIQKPFSIDDLARTARETLRDKKNNP